MAPCKLLFGRKLRTKLDVLPVRKSSVLYKVVWKRVVAKQGTVKAYTEAMLSAKQSALKAGGHVRVRIPFHVKTGQQNSAGQRWWSNE